MTRGDWQRVTRQHPCMLCGRPDWCLYTGPADAPTAAICQRVESDRRAGEGGWLHRLRNDDLHQPKRRTVQVATEQPDNRPIMDFSGFARQCHLACTPRALGQLADNLGLSRESLTRLQVGWSVRHRGWTFPMSDAAGGVVGVRLRLSGGRKLAVKGGREGLFLPTDVQAGERLLIAEGATDCAAMLDLGFPTVGRPSCTGGVNHVCELVQRLQPEAVAVIADNDEPGQRGAEHLAASLLAYVPTLQIVAPPLGVKDARAWIRSGATVADVAAAIGNSQTWKLNVIARRKGGCSR